MQPNKERKQINPVVIGAIIVGIVALVLLIITLMNVFRTNPYGDETKIDNLSDSYSNLPQNEKDLIFFQLYNIIADNVSDSEPVPSSGALVRDGSAEYNYNKDTQVYAGNFIVDIPTVEQSYKVQFEWSPVDNNQNLGGYPVLITCVADDLKIYANDNCKDLFSKNVVWQNEYQIDYTFGTTTSHKIREIIAGFLTSSVDASTYTAAVNEVSLKRLKDQPGITYQFEVVLNGSATYNVTVRTDEMYGESYIAIYIVGGNEKKGFVITDSESYQTTLADWLRNFSGVSTLPIDFVELS